MTLPDPTWSKDVHFLDRRKEANINWKHPPGKTVKMLAKV